MLSSLYRGNAELCERMAVAAQTREVRAQWNELSKFWRGKAEAEELRLGAPIRKDAPSPLPTATFSERSAVEAPALAPVLPEPALASPVGEIEKRQSSTIEESDDEPWARLIDQIRAR